jgi:hypothetical protein
VRILASRRWKGVIDGVDLDKVAFIDKFGGNSFGALGAVVDEGKFRLVAKRLERELATDYGVSAALRRIADAMDGFDASED